MVPFVCVAIYEHRHGIDVRVFDAFAKAQAWKDELGAEYWTRASDDPQPEDACGDEYFDIAYGEYFTICELEVE